MQNKTESKNTLGAHTATLEAITSEHFGNAVGCARYGLTRETLLHT